MSHPFLPRLTVLALVLAAPAVAGSEGLRVIQETPTALTLELTTPKWTFLKTGAVTRVRVPGWAYTRTPGGPELPVAGTLVRVPAGATPRVEVLEETVEVVPGIRLGRVPALVGPEGVETAIAPLADAGGGFLPQEPVLLSDPIRFQGQAQVRVLLHPFRWDPGSGDLRCATRMVVRVTFAPAGFGLAGPGTGPSVAAPGAGRSQAATPATLVPAAPAAPALAPSLEPLNPSGHPGRNPRAPEWREPEQSALRLEVKRSGLYRIGYQDLPLGQMGRPDLAPGDFQLSCQGMEVPVRVFCANGRTLAAGDYLEFYGEALDTQVTGINVYCLSYAGAPARRLQVLDGTPAGSATVTTFTPTLHREENHAWWALTPGAPTSDFWFWEKLMAPARVDHPFTLAALSPGPASLRVTLRGVTHTGTTPGHHTRILVNGTQVADEFWSGQGEFVHDVALPAGLLVPGANTLTVDAPGDTGATVDGVWLNHFEVDWTSPIQAAGDVAVFTADGMGATVIQVAGFTTADLQLYDITNPGDPQRITGAITVAENGKFKATFQDVLAGSKRYWASTAQQCLSPAAISLWKPSGLWRSQLKGADYLLVTPRAFQAAAEPLRRYREAQGLRAMTVAVEDIYTAFSGGVADPQAIQDFLLYAHEYWVAPAPVQVLLLGDATQDYRGYTGLSKQSLVPAHLSVTADLGLTPDDSWFVTPPGAGGMPVMNIGRLPAATAQAAQVVVQKLLAFEASTAAPVAKTLLVADNADPEFQIASEDLARLLPAAMSPLRVYLGPVADPVAANQAILAGFNGGLHTVAYYGHGNVTYWTRNIFQSSDVALLTNGGQLPMVFSFDCLNGYFAAPDYPCLGETLVAAPAGGAVAVFASSGLGYNWEHALLGNQVFTLLYGPGHPTLGEACTQAKILAFGQGASLDLVKIFTLIGDPATRLKRIP